MEKIQFECIKRESKFLSPLKDFQEDTHLIEHRKDPLIGTRSIIGRSMADKARVLFGEPDYNLIQRLAEKSQDKCFFCPDKVATATPKYSTNILPEGRVTVGEATLFPNLFPLSEFHAVCTLTKSHYLNLSDFSPKILADGIQACLEFVKQVYSHNDSANFMTINSNYLFPAGASAIHPHIQVLGGSVPYTYLNSLLENSQQFFKRNNSNFWNDLVDIEKDIGERYVGKTGDIEWLTSFSPLGVNEVQGIIREKSNFLQLSQKDATSLGQGFSNILSSYEEERFSTFNFSIYSGPLREDSEWFWCNTRIISRSNVYENYRTDDYFLQKLLGNEILITSPEDFASKLRPNFGLNA